MNARRWDVMIEVKVVVALMLGVGLADVLVAAVLYTAPHASAAVFLVPATSLILGGLVAAGLVLRMRSSRFAGYGVAILFALIHAFLMLGAQLWWIKVICGLAAAAHIYAVVLLASGPVLRHVGSARA
ncbi:hypothetical protein [Amycolatopsis suaedae]|uniref:Uncharacterized protein n=1 Tax=Amycolatopsis suaedae TaxID=2510978 RepID=A0A4Q7J250_9PSEU|nr:hypothetical protein [Amycolatopsis suaedae]RZQ60014.1 hypothetical protein EWH70_31820 [Amycolatopsis suaedae]